MTMESSHSLRYAKGFTLLELLVVLMLVGFITGAAALRPIQTDSRVLSSSASELRNLIIALATKAVSQNEQVGVLINESSAVAVTQSEEGTWKISDSQQLSLQLSDTVHIKFVENKLLERSSFPGNDNNRLVPDIVLLASGELSAFRLSIINQDLPHEQFELRSDGLNIELRQL